MAEPGFFTEIEKKLNRTFFTQSKQQAFLEDVNSLIVDGVPAPQAIATVYKISEGINKDVAKSILDALAQGKKLADGMEGWFSQPIVEIIRVGEEGGSLTESMDSAAKSLMQTVSIASSLLSSFTYPLIVLVLACAVAIFLRHSIFINFLNIKPVAEWPAVGQNFLAFATFLENYWWFVIIITFLIIFTFTQLFTGFVGATRSILDKFPPFSLYRSLVAARFMEVMGLLISNGITFRDALTIVQHRTTRYLTWHTYLMQERLSGGRENIAEVIDTGLLDHADITRLLVVAKGKGFEHALVRLGARAMVRNSKKLQAAGRVLGGLFLALDAGLAVFMIFAVYSVGVSLGGGAL